MTRAPLFRRGKLRKTLAQLGIEEKRVVAEPPFTYWPLEDDAAYLSTKHLKQTTPAG